MTNERVWPPHSSLDRRPPRTARAAVAAAPPSAPSRSVRPAPQPGECRLQQRAAFVPSVRPVRNPVSHRESISIRARDIPAHRVHGGLHPLSSITGDGDRKLRVDEPAWYAIVVGTDCKTVTADIIGGRCPGEDVARQSPLSMDPIRSVEIHGLSRGIEILCRQIKQHILSCQYLIRPTGMVKLHGANAFHGNTTRPPLIAPADLSLPDNRSPVGRDADRVYAQPVFRIQQTLIDDHLNRERAPLASPDVFPSDHHRSISGHRAVTGTIPEPTCIPHSPSTKTSCPDLDPIR